jgi:hypothetical protein
MHNPLLRASILTKLRRGIRKGKELIIEKIRQGSDQVLFKTTKLPALAGQQPEPLVRDTLGGKFRFF